MRHMLATNHVLVCKFFGNVAKDPQFWRKVDSTLFEVVDLPKWVSLATDARFQQVQRLHVEPNFIIIFERVARLFTQLRSLHVNGLPTELVSTEFLSQVKPLETFIVTGAYVLFEETVHSAATLPKLSHLEIKA